MRNLSYDLRLIGGESLGSSTSSYNIIIINKRVRTLGKSRFLTLGLHTLGILRYRLRYNYQLLHTLHTLHILLYQWGISLGGNHGSRVSHFLSSCNSLNTTLRIQPFSS